MVEMLTARGYEDPTLHQLVVFLPNRVGELGDILRRLDKQSLTVHALTVTDSVDFAVVRIVLSDYIHGKRLFEEMGLQVQVSAILAAELEREQTLLEVCRALIRGEINIHYTYSMLTRPRGKPVILLNVDDVATGCEILRKSGYTLLDDQDILAES